MTRRVAWLTDLHLNFLAVEVMEDFLHEVESLACDVVLLGGDISESPELTHCLATIEARLSAEIHFVLGNHDYYFGSIAGVRREVADFCRAHPRARWLSLCEPIGLTDEVGLVGHDGWADARLGSYERSFVRMNDHRLIEELAAVDKAERWPRLRELGDEAAAHIRRVLPAALDRHRQVVLLTHVPPFRDACWYEGQISNDEWLPHFTCHAMGRAIVEIMRPRIDRRLLVLCGHTHSPGETWPLPNVQVLTGGATYGAPGVQRVFEFQ